MGGHHPQIQLIINNKTMKHLAIHIQAANAAAAATPTQSVAMEGLADTLREHFKAIKAFLGDKDKDMKEQLTLNDRAILEFRNLLVNFKSDLSTGKIENHKAANIASKLAKIGIQADSAKEVISELKKKEAELRKHLSEIAKVAKEAPAVIKKGSESDQAEFTKKAKALKQEIEVKVQVKDSSKEIVFTKREMLELTDVLINYCDLYFKARKQEKLTELTDAAIKAQSEVPALEYSDGGFLGGIAWIIVSVVKFIFWLIVFIIIVQMAMFVILANPFIVIVSAMIATAMYALSDTDDPRLREKNKRS
jgi:hypothetical protein